MSDLMLVEDSSIKKVAPSLERILRDLNESATHHDYVVALLIALLAECSFYVSSSENNLQCPVTKHTPKTDWKSEITNVYEINTRLRDLPDIVCKLIAIPSGDTLIVNFFPMLEEKRTYSIAVQCLKYVNPFSSDLSGRYRNLREISHRFKDKVVTPVRTEILTKAGLISPSLHGLPMEIKLKILKMLSYDSAKNLALAFGSTEFNTFRTKIKRDCSN